MFTVDFDICQLDCDNLLFTETTGQYIPNLSECCKTGYGYLGNPTTDQVTQTLFTITYPNGNVFTDVDLNYLPPVNACDSFTLSGIQGSVVLVADSTTIGEAIFVTSLTQTVNDLVNSVNAGNEQHGYQASSVGNTITICDTCGGSDANGKVIDICIFQLISDETELTLAGGANSGWCFEFGKGLIEGTQVDSCFDDGIYKVTMEVTVDDGVEIQTYTTTKYFLFDCLSRKCLRDLILLSTGANCPCNDKDIHMKIQELRTDLEGAQILLEECQYDCANVLLSKTQKFCNDVCLDCD